MSKIVAVKVNRTAANGELFSVDVIKSDGYKYRKLYAVDGIPNAVAMFAFCGKMAYIGKDYFIYTEDGHMYCDAFNKFVWELFDD